MVPVPTLNSNATINQVLAPLPIGFAVFMVHLATIPVTGTGINPARSFGAAVIYNNDKAWDDQVIKPLLYILAHRQINWSNIIKIFIFNFFFNLYIWSDEWSCWSSGSSGWGLSSVLPSQPATTSTFWEQELLKLWVPSGAVDDDQSGHRNENNDQWVCGNCRLKGQCNQRSCLT